jgi:hypothetical protein
MVYLNTLINAKEDMFLSAEVYEHSRKNIRQDIALSCGIAALALVIGAFYPHFAAWSLLSRTVAYCPIIDVVLALAFVVGVAMLMSKEHRFLYAIHEKMGFRY